MFTKEIIATKDFFAYFLAYYPHFPSEDQVDAKAALNRLIAGVRCAISHATAKTDVDGIHWLALANTELLAAMDAHLRKDVDAVESNVKAARCFFDYFMTKRKVCTENQTRNYFPN